MVLVKLRNSWFPPSQSFHPDAMRVFSGQFFKVGTVEIPDELVEFLPKTAIILEHNHKKVAVTKEVQKEETLKDYDGGRAASDELIKIHETVNKVLKQKDNK